MLLRLLKGLYRLFRCVREAVINLVFMFAVLLGFVILAYLPSPTEQKPFREGALTLNLDGYLADNHEEYGDLYRLLESQLGGRSEPLKISTFDVVQAIIAAKNDERILGIVLDLGNFSGGDLSSLQFIGDELNAYKTATKKPVIAVGEAFSQSQYYLASFADEIYLNPAGFVELNGLSYRNLYFKSLLEKLEAEPHIFRVGTYKAAVEPFLRDEMSPEARENAQNWLKPTWAYVAQRIAENRGFAVEQLFMSSENYLAAFREAGGDEAKFALKRQLVTHLASHSEVQKKLAERFGEEEGSYRHIDFFDYSLQTTDRFEVKAAEKIAVVNIEGEIVWGESDEQRTGSDTVVEQLRAIAQDKAVKGLIVRINSPGGSAMASEIIRQEIAALQQNGLPVVASMGGMAASGGYWIAATSDKIIASPTTLTGSIGIFGLAMNLETTAKKVGVSEDGVETSEFARMSGLKPLSNAQAELIQIGIEQGYDRFLTLVSQGRKMEKTAVDKVAQGQVWTGVDALKHGLVDKLGDFHTAYDTMLALLQAKQADGEAKKGLPLQWFINQDSSLFGSMLGGYQLTLQAQLRQWLGLPFELKLPAQKANFSQLSDPKHHYLYCLTCGEIK